MENENRNIYINNINIESFTDLKSPEEVKKLIPIQPKEEYFVFKSREVIEQIITGKDKRLLFIVGPCSIHNTDEALEYGRKLKTLSKKVERKILIVMRVYFEKPRTTIGWKGLINDPELNNTFNINKGIIQARKLLLELNSIGVPCAYEILDTITPQYICELISWGAIGARTTESQVHRQLVSGLSMPVGFKNGTNGDTNICFDAITSASYPHCFMGINEKGNASICQTKGNKYCHIVLRGGKNEPNYSSEHIRKINESMETKKIHTKIMVDCSHGNSKKDYTNQHIVFEDVIQQYIEQKQNEESKNTIIGVMIESNLYEGKQKLDFNFPEKLERGISITDSCISFETTEKIILDCYKRLINQN
jgi:3-deoxy-7-phosphoheptulonate synthase